MKKILIVILSLVISASFIGCSNPKDDYYTKAVKAYTDGDYVTAKVLFQQNADYKDSGDYLKKITDKEDAGKAAGEQAAAEIAAAEIATAEKAVADQIAADKAAADKAAADKAAADKAAADKAAADKAAAEKAAADTETYSIVSVRDAVIISFDEKSGELTYRPECPNCGALMLDVTKSAHNRPFIIFYTLCSKCSSNIDVRIETKTNYS